jgi:uncharacterized protein
MGNGKKNDVLAENPSVCFTVFEEFGTVADSIPCKCDTSYLSVVIFGKAVLVQDIDEKTQVLMQIMGKFMPDFFKNPLSTQFVDKNAWEVSMDTAHKVIHFCDISDKSLI